MTEKRFKIEKHPLYREEIKAALTEAIVSGQLKPGERIVETRWARELGVSQSPIREAIRELEMVGLVETIPYKGCIVRKLTEKDLVDTYEVRNALESLAICEVIHEGRTDDLDEMKALMTGMREAAENGDVKQFIEQDVLFHEQLVNQSQNEILRRLWQQCGIRDNTRISTLLSEKTLSTLAERHQAILDVIEARDEERAKKVISEHFSLLIEGIRNNMKD